LRHHIASYDELQYFYTFFSVMDHHIRCQWNLWRLGGGFPKLGTTTSSLSRPQSVGICNFAVIFYHRRPADLESWNWSECESTSGCVHQPLTSARSEATPWNNNEEEEPARWSGVGVGWVMLYRLSPSTRTPGNSRNREASCGGRLGTNLLTCLRGWCMTIIGTRCTASLSLFDELSRVTGGGEQTTSTVVALVVTHFIRENVVQQTDGAIRLVDFCGDTSYNLFIFSGFGRAKPRMALPPCCHAYSRIVAL